MPPRKMDHSATTTVRRTRLRRRSRSASDARDGSCSGLASEGSHFAGRASVPPAPERNGGKSGRDLPSSFFPLRRNRISLPIGGSDSPYERRERGKASHP